MSQVKIISEEARLNFLPKNFGDNTFIQFEQTVYLVTDKMLEDYIGGYWEFAYFNDIPFMFMDNGEDLVKVNHIFGNGQYELPDYLAGLVITLFACGIMAERAKDDATLELFDGLRYKLLDAGYTLAGDQFNTEFFNLVD